MVTIAIIAMMAVASRLLHPPSSARGLPCTDAALEPDWST